MTVLNRSALHCLRKNNVTLTKMNADMMYSVMNYMTNTNFKSRANNFFIQELMEKEKGKKNGFKSVRHSNAIYKMVSC